MLLQGPLVAGEEENMLFRGVLGENGKMIIIGRMKRDLKDKCGVREGPGVQSNLCFRSGTSDWK